jgi:hypothetical protein
MDKPVEEIDELLDLARLARRSLEPGLPRSASSAPNSAGACLHACLVIVVLLKQFGRGVPLIRGGADGAGAKDTLGNWCGHYWTVVRMPSGSEFVVDITADQFGYAPVVVMPLHEARESYRDGPQEEVDAAFLELSQEYGCEELGLELTTGCCIVN